MNVTDETSAIYKLNSADKSHRFCIGIDPDKDRNGVAMWDRRNQKLVRFERMTTPKTILFCCDHKEDAFVYLEAGHLINYIWGLNPSWNQQKTASVSRDKGVNNGFGLCLKQWLEHYLIAHIEVKPEGKKWTREDFKIFTGQETIDQELIDAVKLVYGR